MGGRASRVQNRWLQLSEEESDHPAEQPASPHIEAEVPAQPRRIRLILAVGLAVLVIDQLTKAWALERLDAGRTIDLVWTLRLNLVFNPGAAFSSGESFGPVIGILAIGVVVAFVLMSKSLRTTAANVCVGAIVGGAAGNLADRLFRGDGFLNGKVIDFIDFQWYPVFNIADMGVVCGGIALVIFGGFAKSAEG